MRSRLLRLLTAVPLRGDQFGVVQFELVVPLLQHEYLTDARQIDAVGQQFDDPFEASPGARRDSPPIPGAREGALTTTTMTKPTAPTGQGGPLPSAGHPGARRQPK